MIITSKNYHKINEMCKEEYYLLLYNSNADSFNVIRGFFVRKKEKFPWNGAEKLYKLDDFLERFPGNEKIINELKEDINKQLASPRAI